jgi:hypothetical protein
MFQVTSLIRLAKKVARRQDSYRSLHGSVMQTGLRSRRALPVAVRGWQCMIDALLCSGITGRDAELCIALCKNDVYGFNGVSPPLNQRHW